MDPTTRPTKTQINKDETEQQLEKILFGDEVAFHENLKFAHDGKELSVLKKDSTEGQNDSGALDPYNLERADDSDVSRGRVLDPVYNH